jgi:hypothetical protein
MQLAHGISFAGDNTCKKAKGIIQCGEAKGLLSALLVR